MAKARGQRQTTTTWAGMGTKRPAASQGSTIRSRWTVVLVVMVIAAVVGFAAWWERSSSGGGDGTGDPQPIATLDAPDVHSILVEPSDPDHVLFGSHSGIHESRDGGLTWRAGTLGNADAMGLATSPKDPRTMYVAGHDVFQISQDGGASWHLLDHNLPGTDLHALAQDLTDPSRLYALVTGSGIFTSADGGTTWSSLPTQPSGGGMHGALAADGTILYAATGAGLVLSRDRGTTWDVPVAQPGEGVTSLAISAVDPRTIYAGTQAGLTKTVDGGATWMALGPANNPILAVAVAPSDPNRVLVVDGRKDVYRSDDAGISWVTPR